MEDFNWVEFFISTGISSGISIGATYIFMLMQKRSVCKAKIDERLENILKVAITYPYLENKNFCNSWNPSSQPNQQNDERFQRYDVYCNLIFNLLVEIASFYKYDKQKIENYVDIKTWVRLHKKCWKHPLNDENENKDSYDQKFVNFINSYV